MLLKIEVFDELKHHHHKNPFERISCVRQENDYRTRYCRHCSHCCRRRRHRRQVISEIQKPFEFYSIYV